MAALYYQLPPRVATAPLPAHLLKCCALRVRDVAGCEGVQVGATLFVPLKVERDIEAKDLVQLLSCRVPKMLKGSQGLLFGKIQSYG
ncbi:hypothetical protein D3C72_1883590 [compost metagenome]